MRSTTLVSYDFNEVLGTKLRTPFQRIQGRDDLYAVLIRGIDNPRRIPTPPGLISLHRITNGSAEGEHLPCGMSCCSAAGSPPS
jgi:hypothetical protein